MTEYERFCDWFAVHGDPEQEAREGEFNAAYDDQRERFSGNPDGEPDDER